MYIDHSNYHSVIFNPKRLKATVARAAKKLLTLQKKLKFDAIVFRGQSGAGVAYPVSALTGIPLVHVRKREQTHGLKIEGPGKRVKRYIILDDFVSTGATVRAITKALAAETAWGDERDHLVCVGVALYDDAVSETEVWDHKRKKLTLYSVR